MSARMKEKGTPMKQGAVEAKEGYVHKIKKRVGKEKILKNIG